MPFRLSLPRRHLDAMIAQALAEFPHECVGLLAGVMESPKEGDDPAEPVGRVVERYPLANVLASPIEYESEPRGMFEAVRDMRKRGIDVLAVYHSHPTSEPVPSRKDRERNYSPGVVNFILSLMTTPPTIRGWWLTADDYREAEWECVE
jgi:proteasome lid subunit RPN8/RPN11